MRKHYIDNLRNITILLLFPVHTFMIWNDFGVKFYVWQGESRLLSTLIVLINPWFMPLLFALAGVSARYSLQKRSYKEFAANRVQKLLIPFICGMVLLVPFQTFFCRKFFFDYDGGLFRNLQYFFTNYTDLSGYDGAFTPGHLWFILFLFVISMFSLIVFKLIPYEKAVSKIERLPSWGALLLFIPVWLMYYLGNFGGFSLGKNLALFLLGYYVLGSDKVIETLEKNIKWLSSVWAVGIAALGVLYWNFAYYGDLLVNYVGWTSILVFIVFGKRCLNKKTKFTEYFNGASYPIYILHQSILVALAYYVLQICTVFPLQPIIIATSSFALTVLAYHIIKLVPILRTIIGLSLFPKRAGGKNDGSKTN